MRQLNVLVNQLMIRIAKPHCRFREFQGEGQKLNIVFAALILLEYIESFRKFSFSFYATDWLICHKCQRAYTIKLSVMCCRRCRLWAVLLTIKKKKKICTSCIQMHICCTCTWNIWSRWRHLSWMAAVRSFVWLGKLNIHSSVSTCLANVSGSCCSWIMIGTNG